MRLSVELLDHIFSFLVSDQRTIVACSKDPVLFPIIERQLYYHTIVRFAKGWHESGCGFEPECLSKLVSEDPRILNYVRILQIQVDLHQMRDEDQAIMAQLDEFAETLLMFPFLECIILTTSKRRIWSWPDVFRAALEDRLNLPTVKEVHIVGKQYSPFSLIGNCENIENLLLSGSFTGAVEGDDATPLQLKSLTLPHISYSLVDSIKLHINRLQSLRCAQSSVDHLPELLGVCSKTLNRLDIDLTHSQYFSNHSFRTGKNDNTPFPELSPIPPNLERLTIRAPVSVENEFDEDFMIPKNYESYLPAAAEIIKSFVVSPPQSLVLDINVHLFEIPSNLTTVDFSPLAVLGAAALSIPRIDLYVHTGILPSDDTFAQLLSSLADSDDVMRAIEKGILNIQSEATAPDYYVKEY